MLNKIFHGLVVAMTGALACADACAQAYPSKPVRIIVPYAPGGGVDIVARALGQELTKRLGQQIVVENKTGAGGNIGSDAVAKATPDGYTLLIASPANAVNPSLYAKMPFNPVRDLVPVALIASVPAVLLASPALPVRNVKELVAQLNREIVAALGSPEMKDRLQAMSAKPLPGTPAQFAAFFADEMTRWARVVKASGAKAE